MALKHKYNIPNMLLSVLGYKGIPYPMGFVRNPRDKAFNDPSGDLVQGTRLRQLGPHGIWYFMPVFVKHPRITATQNSGDRGAANTLQLPHAVIGITGKKTIVSTPMVGHNGVVKELINVDDYKITIAAFIQSKDGSYPDEQISQIRELFNINESVELISVLTDLVLDPEDKVVITHIEYPSIPGVEDGQAIKMECVTDRDFKLILD